MEEMVFAQIPKARSNFCAFSKKDSNPKIFTVPLGADSKFILGSFANLCKM
jgi:hypothetical protein